MTDEDGDAVAAITLDPPLPPLGELTEGEPLFGRWRVDIDGDAVTGGTWRALRQGPIVDLALEVTEPWTPSSGLPLMMRVVTRSMPVFRQWPTSYRWTAEVYLDEAPATIASRWERTGAGGSESYRRATGS